MQKRKVPRDIAPGIFSIDSISISSAPEIPLLFKILRQLDHYAGPQQPVDTAVWVAALAAPLIARECRRSADRRALSNSRRLRREGSRSFDDMDDSSGSSSSGSEGAEELAAIASVAANSTRFTYEEESTLRIIHHGNEVVGEESSSDGTAVGTVAVNSTDLESDSSLRDELRNGTLQGDSTDYDWETDDGITNQDSESSPSPTYLIAYGKIVDKVMTRMLSSPDAKAQRILASAALPSFTEDSTSTGTDGKKRRIKRKKPIGSVDPMEDSESNLSLTGDKETMTTPHGVQPLEENVAGIPDSAEDNKPVRSVPVIQCVLPRQAVEMAREFLKLEAELRGQELPEPEGKEGKKKLRHRQRRRRRLGANEHLLFQLLRSPEINWEKATSLGADFGKEETS